MAYIVLVSRVPYTSDREFLELFQDDDSMSRFFKVDPLHVVDHPMKLEAIVYHLRGKYKPIPWDFSVTPISLFSEALVSVIIGLEGLQGFARAVREEIKTYGMFGLHEFEAMWRGTVPYHLPPRALEIVDSICSENVEAYLTHERLPPKCRKAVAMYCLRNVVVFASRRPERFPDARVPYLYRDIVEEIAKYL